MENMDLVYILGKGSLWGDNELRYSIRSAVKNMKFRNIVIVGNKPEWLTNVVHIPMSDNTRFKGINTLQKLKMACISRKVSKDFILMNDDFYILDKINDLPYYSLGLMSDKIKKYEIQGNSGTKYYFAMVRTNKLFKNCMNFDPHLPIILNKVKFIKLFSKYNLNEWVLYRTVYCNHYGLTGPIIDDVKVYSVNDFYKLTNTNFMSTSPDSALKPAIQKFLDELFLEATKYEL